MIVSLRHGKGGYRMIECDHFVHHVEEGRDSWVELIGIKSGDQRAHNLNNSYLIKALASYGVWEHGILMRSYQVPLSIKLGRSK